MTAQLYLIAGPSGVGKGTIVEQLKQRYPNLYVSISTTSRNPRAGEVDGIHYNFVSKAQFEQLIQEGKMLEYAYVHGQNYYGTAIEPLQDKLASGYPVLLEIDLDGVRQVKQKMPECVLIFIEPPSWRELEKRLVGRGTESSQDIARRLETAKIELAAKNEFDYVVVNDDLQTAVTKVAQIMHLE